MGEGVEIAVRLPIGGEDLVEPRRVEVEAIVVEGGQQLPQHNADGRIASASAVNAKSSLKSLIM